MPHIRLAASNEYSEIASFIGRHWKKNHAYTRSKELFDWTFLNSPAWTEDGYSISLAIDSEAIVGMLGIIPFELNVRGQLFKSCWLVNWLLVPEARQGRAGLDLLKFFSKTYCYDTISFGINDTVARLYTALKWQHMPPISRMVWINASSVDAAEKLLVETNPRTHIDDIKQYISLHSSSTEKIQATKIKYLSLDESDEWNNKGWQHWKIKTVGCNRDFEYLNWRYLQHPKYRYETRLISDGMKLGLIVWRIETASKASFNGGLEDYVLIARIVEFLPVSDQNALFLMSEFIAHAEEAGAIAGDFYCYNAEICQMLNRIGFLTSNDQATVALPNYTQPVANGGNIRSAINIARSHQIDAADSSWYWTRSDSDQDRPN